MEMTNLKINKDSQGSSCRSRVYVLAEWEMSRLKQNWQRLKTAHNSAELWGVYWCFNSLDHSGKIWQQRYWSILFQVMACCLTAPSHYLNRCSLTINEILCSVLPRFWRNDPWHWKCGDNSNFCGVSSIVLTLLVSHWWGHGPQLTK